MCTFSADVLACEDIATCLFACNSIVVFLTTLFFPSILYGLDDAWLDSRQRQKMSIPVVGHTQPPVHSVLLLFP